MQQHSVNPDNGQPRLWYKESHSQFPANSTINRHAAITNTLAIPVMVNRG